jgi:hypothetical protein
MTQTFNSKAMDKKWEELACELTTDKGTRAFRIIPHFQKVLSGWFDTGKYTVYENDKVLGNIYVDLYTGRKPQWDGSMDEFSYEQLYELVNRIVFKDVVRSPDLF